MDINIGDKVRFLNDIGGGTVSGFQKGGIVLVQDEDGFDVPVRSSEVVVVSNDSTNKQESQTAPSRPVIIQKPRKEKPEEPTEEDLRIAELKEYYKKRVPTPSTIQSEKVEEKPSKAPETLESRILTLEMTVRKLQMRLERLEDAKALREKIKTTEVRKHTETTNRNEPVEVDLHADELLETTAGMGAREIKEYQLQVVSNTMNEHLHDTGHKIVFIHGNGEGVLRKAVIDLLHREFPSCPYQDASFQQYGFGATMVTIH